MSVGVDAIPQVRSAPAGRPRRRLALFVFLLVLCNLIWAAQLNANNYLGAFLGPLAVAFLPIFIVTPLMLPLLARSRRQNPGVARPSRNDWMRFTVAGLVGQLVAQLGMTWGSIRGEASSCGILYLLVPVFTAMMASALLGERLTGLRVLCLLVGLGGAAFMSSRGVTGQGFLESRYAAGNLLMLIGCLGAAFYNVYCKGLMARYPERDVLIYSYITATLGGLPLLLWLEPDCLSRLAHMHGWLAWGAFAFNALIVMGVSMLMLFYVLQFLPVTIVLASTYLLPVFAVALGMLLLGERLHFRTVAGGLVVLIATSLVMRYDASPEAPSGGCPVLPPTDAGARTRGESELPPRQHHVS